MIANEIAFGKSFADNINYNIHGKASEPNPHKCAWHVARNLFTDDLEVASKVMEATASSSRATKPAYHFSIDWDRSEERFLDKDKCVEAADTVLAKIGLSDHQALYFWHVDADHPHMHVVVNRVHEHTGKAWDMWKSKERLERATHEVARDMNLLEVPGKHNALDYTPENSKRASQSRQQRAKAEELTPWNTSEVNEVKQQIGGAFYEANTWGELFGQLEDAGYQMAQKGQGYIVSDGTNYTQLSKLGKQIRISALEEKFGESLDSYKQRTTISPATEKSPVESFDKLNEKLDQQISRDLKTWEAKQPIDQEKLNANSTTLELLSVLNSIERFNAALSHTNSKRDLFKSKSQVMRADAKLAKAETLLSYHQERSMELLVKIDPDHKPSENASILDSLRSAIKNEQRKNKRRSNTSKLLTAVANRLKKQKREEAEHANKRKQRSNEWQLYYRMQKLREARSRIEAIKFERQQAREKFKALDKAEKQNSQTQKSMVRKKTQIIGQLSKQEIIQTNLPWQDKKRLLANWYAEQEKKRSKEKSKDRDLDRDPFDDR